MNHLKALRKKLTRIRRHIHMNPELGNNEFSTARFIEEELGALSISTKRIGKTGVVGILHSSIGQGNCFALRADMDALPITTQIKKPYASKIKGCMHACGHDGNMAIVLGAADILSKNSGRFTGSVKFIFQPNEELAGGAVELIRRGVLSNPDVNAIAGIHANSQIPSGSIGLKRGPMMASVDRFILEIIGEGGHGAYPHDGNDAIVIASHVIQAIQTFTSRYIDATEPVVVTVGKIHGGERFNILAGSVVMEGTVRSLSKKMHHDLPIKLERVIKNCVESWGADCRWKYEIMGETLVNNETMIHLARNAAVSFMDKDRILYLEKPSMGGEDFSEYLKAVPGCFLYLGTCSNKKTSFGWHHPKFDLDEDALPVGSELLARMAMEYLK